MTRRERVKRIMQSREERRLHRLFEGLAPVVVSDNQPVDLEALSPEVRREIEVRRAVRGARNEAY